jgi:hypothetical protein
MRFVAKDSIGTQNSMDLGNDALAFFVIRDVIQSVETEENKLEDGRREV